MVAQYVAIGAIFGLTLGCCASLGDDAHLPRPLSNHPGNVFVVGEAVDIPVPTGCDWELTDYDGQQVSKGIAGKESVPLGLLPVGWYQLSWFDKEKKTTDSTAISVLAPLMESVSASSPIGVDAGMMYIFHRKKNSTLDISYGPEDVANLVALTGAGWIRDRMWWKAYDFVTRSPSEKEVPDLDFEACHAEGLRVLATVYEAPSAYRLPEESGVALTRKPPYQLEKVYAYFQMLAGRYPDTVQEWETWNEPEGIGGNLLSYEIAAVQKTAYLAIKKQSPAVQSSMGMGRVSYPEHLNANGYLDFVDTYNFHSHQKQYQELKGQFDNLKPYHDQRPLWLTECSSGSFPTIPGVPGELSLDQAKKQANTIPKLFSRALFYGARKMFYFYFFSYTEVGGEVFGLMRERDLVPRPGYNALATTGRLLASATQPEIISGLPEGGEGYQFRTADHGKPTRTSLMWNESSSADWDWNVPEGSTVFDTIGRSITPVDGKIKVGSAPVYIVTKDNGPVASVSNVAAQQSPPCPVVMDMLIADRYKNDVGDYLEIPYEENFLLPLDIYNFSDKEASGVVKITFPPVLEMPARTLSIKLAPGQHLTQQIIVNCPRIQKNGAEPSRIDVEGDFGALGKSVMAADFKLQVRKLSEQDICKPVEGAQEGTHWQAHLDAKAAMKSHMEGNWTIFDWAFGPANNKANQQVWAAPSLSISAESIPAPYPDGLAIDIRQISGPKLKLAVNVVEKNGAAYVGFLDLNEADLHSDGGMTAVVPFDGMTNPPYRIKDDNGHLDIGDIRSIEIAAWTEPDSNVTLAFKNLRWVNFVYKKSTP